MIAMGQEIRHRIGIMGGTFDPIHIGHLILAECAYEQFKLEKILFLPSGNPPHKQEREDGAADAARIEMVRLAIADNPHFVLDPEEMYRSGYTYTCDTLRIMKEKHPDTEYYFILGADSLMTFETWRNPRAICQNCILAVAVRDQLSEKTMEQKMNELREKYDASVFFLHTPDMEISSSHLRRKSGESRSIRYLVPEPVREYIEARNLYRQ